MSDNLTLLHTFEPHEKVVAMVQYRDSMYLATEGAIYRVTGDGDDVRIELLQLKTFLRGKNADTQDALADFEERFNEHR